MRVEKIHIGESGCANILSYMKNQVHLRLRTTAEQVACLERLQVAFAEACNELGPLVRETRCWNRVALHHLAYHRLRERFPALGSQMVCNAIYSVCRSARAIYQNPGSPWCVDKRLAQGLPLMRFAPSAPVFFDRHTLSVKRGRLSLYTLDGRVRFDMEISEENERRFAEEKLREIQLRRDQQGFSLLFSFGELADKGERDAELPEYVVLVESNQAVKAA